MSTVDLVVKWVLMITTFLITAKALKYIDLNWFVILLPIFIIGIIVLFAVILSMLAAYKQITKKENE